MGPRLKAEDDEAEHDEVAEESRLCGSAARFRGDH
jgi:hypothetical protein